MTMRPPVFFSPSISIRFTKGYMTDWKGISIAAVNTRKRNWLIFVLIAVISVAQVTVTKRKEIEA